MGITNDYLWRRRINCFTRQVILTIVLILLILRQATIDACFKLQIESLIESTEGTADLVPPACPELIREGFNPGFDSPPAPSPEGTADIPLCNGLRGLIKILGAVTASES